MKFVMFPALAALLLVSACNSTSNGMRAAEINDVETPSDGVVPGQLPQ